MKYWPIFVQIGLLTSCNGQVKTNNPGDQNKAVSTTEGIVYFSNDFGQSWSNQSNGIPGDVFLTDISASGDLLGISTKQHGIYLYDFVSGEWTPIKRNKPISPDIDALLISENKIYAGTQGEGVFVSEDRGESWESINAGLENLTIRRLTVLDNRLYAGTNGGLFSFADEQNRWVRAYGNDNLQVNGIALLDNEIYIGTNKGAYKATLNQHNWRLILPDRSLHNISTADGIVYAMVYSELFASKDKGENWYGDQSGMPVGMYSFQVVEAGDIVLDGQWDGVYRKDNILNWVKLNTGLPIKIPVTEMRVWKNILVVASSQWCK
ncbi:MAG: hypothetical protein IPK76_22685 [Lewinellaceae bacterium]|jgi:photosystem II stability/assembly factor-like uncharacterized protein|nr:hypothetical protein [Lewinellaceae bacterium]